MVLWRLQSTLPTQHGFWIMISHLQLPAARNRYPYCTWNCRYKLSKRSPLLKWLWWSLTKLWASSSSVPFSQWTELDLPDASTWMWAQKLNFHSKRRTIPKEIPASTGTRTGCWAAGSSTAVACPWVCIKSTFTPVKGEDEELARPAFGRGQRRVLKWSPA